jgi:hypothetical protein
MRIFLLNIWKRISYLFLPEPKKILGRWNMEICDKKINRKIDFSNEDHCGPCGNTENKTK